MPLHELWDSKGTLNVSKKRDLGGNEIKGLLRQGSVRFVVANLGHSLKWIPLSSSYDFWKTEAKPRIVETETFYLADYPGEYCYYASEWSDDEPTPIVLLEMRH
jgi:hypothetical protein